jgi:hypothetical protein
VTNVVETEGEVETTVFKLPEQLNAR